MRASRARLLAAGKALHKLEARGEDGAVKSVRVQGREVKDPAAALAAYREEAARAVPSREPGVLDRVADGMDERIDALEERLEKSRFGRRLSAMLQRSPERVSFHKEVELELEGGEVLRLPVEVLDRRATELLKTGSLASEVASLTPIIGPIFPLGSAVVAGLASVLARAVGKRPLAAALARTSAKHAVLGGADLVPVLGDAAAAFAAVLDTRRRRELRKAPTVAALASLAEG